MQYKLLFILLLFFAAACSSNKTEKAATDYKQHKESIEEQEKKNPLNFLKVDGTHKKNLLGKTVVNGLITNTAAICSYKNVRVKMLSYKNSNMVEEHEDVIEDIVQPNNSIHFKTRYRLPKGTDSIALSIMSAEVSVK